MRFIAIALLWVWAALPATAQTSIFDLDNRLVQFALSQISSPGSFEITADLVEDAEGATRLNGVKISDGFGTWMTIEQLVVDWNSSAILRGTLELERIIVRGLDMPRAPSANAEAPELDVERTQGTPSPFDWPRAPIPVVVEAMTLEDIRIGSEVLGQSLTFDGSGSARDQGDEQRIALTITRTDDIAGEIALDYLRDFAAETLGITLEANEAPGGIVALLGGFPADSATTVSLSGQGPRDAWALSFDAATDEVFEARGEATVSYVEPLGAVADFTLVPGPQLSPTIRAVTGARAELEVDVEQGADRVLRINALQLDSPALRLTGRGSFDLDSQTSDLALIVEGEEELSDLVDGLRFDGFAFDGQVTGPPDDLTAIGQANLRAFRSAVVDADRVALTVNARRIGERLRVTADGTGTGLRLDALDAETVGEAALRIDVTQEGDQVELATARLDSPLLTLSASGRTDLSFTNADLSFDFSADSIRQIAAAYGQQAQGELALIGRIQRNEGVLDGRITGRATGLRSDPADMDTLALLIELGQADEDIVIRLEGDATGLRLDRLEGDLLGPARIDARATFGAEALTLNGFTLESAPLSIEATGRQERETGRTTFTARAQTSALGPLAEAYGIDADGRLDLRLEGGLTEGVLDATVRTELASPRFADIVRAERLVLDANVIGNAAQGWTTRAALDGEALTALDLPASAIGPVRLETEARLADGVLDVAQFDLTSRLADATGAVRLDTATGDLTARAEANMPRLAPLAALAGQPVEGSLRLAGQASRTAGLIAAEAEARLTRAAYGTLAELQSADLSLALEGPADDLVIETTGRIADLRLDRLTPDLIGPVTLEARARLTDGTLDTATAALRSDIVEATVTPLAGGRGLAYTLDSTNIAPLASAYGTQASGVLRADGIVTLGPAVEVTGDVAANGLVVQGNRLGTLTLDHEVTLAEGLAASLRITGRDGLLADTDARAELEMVEGVLDLSTLDGTLAGQQVRGRLRTDLATLLTDGEIELLRADLARLPLVDLSGRGAGRVTLDARDGRQDATATFALTGAGAGAITARDAQVRVAATNLLGGDPGLDADATLGDVELGAARIDAATLDATGRLSALDVALTARGEAAGRAVDLDTAARVSATGGTTRIAISMLDGAFGEAEIALAAPLDLTIAGGTVQARDIAVVLPGDGRLTGSVDLIGGGLVGTLEADGIDLATLAEEADIPVLAGRLDAQASFDTRPGRARATLDGSLVDFVGSDVLEEGLSVDATFGADWNGRIVAATARIDGGFEEPFEMAARVPVSLRGGSPVPQPNMNGPLEATVRWAGEVRPLWAFVPAPGQILSGRATLDLDVTGTLAAPRVGGNVSLSDGRYENLDVGTILTELTIISDLDPTGNLAFALQGSDGGRGLVFGTLALDTTGGALLLDAEVEAEEAVLLRRDDLTAQVSGTVTVTGPLDALDIGGDLLIDRAEFRLVNATPPDIVTLGDVRILGEPEEEEEARAPASIDLDIDIRAPGALFVRGRGLESEWGLSLDVRGTAAQPRITGQIERLRGTFTLIGRNFDLTEGAIVFDGGATIDPRLNIVLSRTDDDLTGQIIISGIASDPRITFASQPALPEEEVLPRLLFGQSQQSLNAGQALQLASGIATLLSGNAGPFDVARNALGVDVLQLDAGDGGDGATLTVGKTLGQGVFVGAETALDGSGEDTIVIELDVIRNVVIDARIGTGDGSSSLGITYSRDF